MRPPCNTVVLDAQPTADVTVTVGGYTNTDVTPNPTTLTFTADEPSTIYLIGTGGAELLL